MSETPPRTWRRLSLTQACSAISGNTSTDVEKTREWRRRCTSKKKHLHGGGEDLRRPLFKGPFLETPPRTWRRLSTWARILDGNKKHLHGRGEDAHRDLIGTARLETPPRTWRRRTDCLFRLYAVRNTSTDVEKTPSRFQLDTEGWKHLHGRGEDRCNSSPHGSSLETPPRTWRRLE